MMQSSFYLLAALLAHERSALSSS